MRAVATHNPTGISSARVVEKSLRNAPSTQLVPAAFLALAIFARICEFRRLHVWHRSGGHSEPARRTKHKHIKCG